MQLFEVTVRADLHDVTLLVVATDEAEARVLARTKGIVRAVDANHGPFTVRGSGRVIGAVEEPPVREAAN